MVFYFSTSSLVGIDDEDPLRVTVIDEAREANFKVSSISNPRTSPEIKYPINVSPAAVVSTAYTLYAGCSIITS